MNSFQRRSNEQSVGEVLKQITSNGKIADKINQARVVAAYEEIVGRDIALMTQSLSVKRRVLYLKVESSSLKHELVYAKSLLLHKFNEKLDNYKLDDIVVS